MSEEKTTPQDIQQTPRSKVLICDQEFYSEANTALGLISLEVATRGMKKAEFADFAGRYHIRIELWTSADGNTKMALCEGGNVLGDWCPE